jgi:hypothetical protein
LQLSKSQAAPGDTITVAGDGYARCTDDVSQITSVWLLEDGVQIATVSGSGGGFSAPITVAPGTSAGNHTVAAECENTSVILASSVLTVTEPSGGGSSSSGQGSSSSGQGSSNSGQGSSNSGQGSSNSGQGSSNSGQGSSNSGQGSSNSGQGSSNSGQGGGSSGSSSAGRGTPIALMSGVGGGLVLAILFVLWALTTHAGKGHHHVRWVKEHLRAVAGSSLGLPSAKIDPRPGARSLSVGLEPHGDHFGIHEIKEVAP